MFAAGVTGLKSFRFSSLGRAARVDDAVGPTRQPDDTADEQHGLQGTAAARATSAAGEDTVAPDGASPGSADNDVDSDAGRKRKAEGQGVLSPAQAGLQPAAATAVLVKRRASPTLPMALPIGRRSNAGVSADGSRGAVPNGGAKHRPEASAAVQRPNGTGTALTAKPAQPFSSSAVPGKHSAVKLPSRHSETCDEDEDEDDTVLPGNSRLAARVLAGRQSLAPSRAQVRRFPHGALVSASADA